ncbi:MAG TPA: sugar phosphate isomerase/epimerase family protein [Thermoguttaceae bacterium]|nr:sugar phosphate isomerase/epimerase family protein [Thermoguttaceae bacterium]
MADFRHYTRREFLSNTARIAAASTAAAALTRSAAVAKSCASEVPWQIGCYTRPWAQYDYQMALDAIAEAGFKHVGLMSTKPKKDAKRGLVITVATSIDEAAEVGQQAQRRGLQIPSIYGGPIPVNRSLQEGIDGLKKLIDNCAAAGGKTLLTAGINREELEATYYKAVAECCDYAAEKRVAITLKPHGPLNATGRLCRKAIERVGNDNFSLWYDPGNIFAYSDGALDPVDDAATVDGLVTGMCVKDYRRATDDVKVTPGEGAVDFARVMARLRQGGFAGGPLVIETLTPGDPTSLIQEAEKARRFVERLVGVES